MPDELSASCANACKGVFIAKYAALKGDIWLGSTKGGASRGMVYTGSNLSKERNFACKRTLKWRSPVTNYSSARNSLGNSLYKAPPTNSLCFQLSDLCDYRALICTSVGWRLRVPLAPDSRCFRRLLTRTERIKRTIESRLRSSPSQV